MSAAGTVSTIIVGLFGLIVIVSAAVVVARAQFVKAQLEALRGDRDDLMKRVELLEQDNLRLSDAFEASQEKVRVLQALVTGKEQLDHIQETLDAQNRTTSEWRLEQRRLALDILGLLGGQRDGEIKHDAD